MTLPVFNPSRNPDQKPDIEETPNVLKTAMGDGYVQRAGNGINNILQNDDLSWTNIDTTSGMAIINFFRDKKGYLPFTYQLPWESSPRTWIAESWKFTPINGKYMSITSAKFVEAAPI